MRLFNQSSNFCGKIFSATKPLYLRKRKRNILEENFTFTKERKMSETGREKITILNKQFKDILDLARGEERIVLNTVLSQRDLAGWRLCASYIDWWLCTNHNAYEGLILQVLETFVNMWEEEPTKNISISIRNFHQLLIILSLYRWDLLGINIKKVDAEELEEEIEADKRMQLFEAV